MVLPFTQISREKLYNEIPQMTLQSHLFFRYKDTTVDSSV